MVIKNELAHVENAECRCAVKVDVFEVKEYCVDSCTCHVFPLEDERNRKQHDSVHHRVVLKMNIVDQEKTQVDVV